ncbi:MAG: hypothetical protein NVSMB36_13550 [Escherichia coli]
MESFIDGKYIDVAGTTDIVDGRWLAVGATYDGSLKASGVKLALDGDLIRYDSKEPGKTELATRKLAGKLGMSDSEIRRQLEKGDSFSFEETALYKKVYQLAEAKTGKSLPREMLPGIQLESPKITRNLTTAWFAKRVDERRARCMKQ